MKSSLKLATLFSLFSIVPLFADFIFEPEGEQKKFPSAPPSTVRLVNPASNIDLEFTALILQPSGSNLQLGVKATPESSTSDDWKIYELNPSYHFGFNLDFTASGHISHTNFSINWEHFRSATGTTKTSSTEGMIGPFFEIGPDASPYKTATGKVYFELDVLNLDYGIYVNFGRRLLTNLFAGIAIARVERDLHTVYASLDGQVKRSIEAPSTFSGAGPRIGFDFSYQFWRNFHFVGKTAAALLSGPIRTKSTYHSTAPNLTPLVQRTSINAKTQLVPEVDSKLGFSYAQVFKKHYTVKIEGGFQTQVFASAIQTIDIGSEIAPTPHTAGIVAQTFQKNISNFTLAGPYAAFDFGF